jgi:putative flippase GtrA
MHDYQFGSGSRAGDNPDGPHHYSTLSLVLLIVGLAIAAAVGLGIVFWVLGFLFHLVGWIVKIAILAAVAAFIWRRIAGRRDRRI